MKKLLLPLLASMLITSGISAQDNAKLSGDVLNGFYLLEESLNRSGRAIKKQNEKMLVTLEYSMMNAPEKTKPFYDRAMVTHREISMFIEYVDDLKKDLVNSTGGRREDKRLTGAADMDYHTTVLIDNGIGEELKAKTNKLKLRLISMLDSAGQQEFKTGPFTKNELSLNPDWSGESLKNMPLAEVMALLSKIQNEALLAEFQVLTTLTRAIVFYESGFPEKEVKIVPGSTSVILGGEYQADIFLYPSNDRFNHQVLVNGQHVKVEGNIGKFTHRPTSEGEVTYTGIIKEIHSSGETIEYPFRGSYHVYKPSASISAIKMNVLYIGVDNPVSVAVPGVVPDNVTVSATDGVITRTGSKGSYIVRVPEGKRQATIHVSAKVDDKTMPMGAMSFRVRPLPDPKIVLGTINAPTVTAEHLKTVKVVYLSIGEGFAFEGISFTVTGFSFMHIPKEGIPVKLSVEGSSSLSPEMKELCNKAVPGEQVMIFNVKGKGPAGLIKPDSSLLLTVL
jgi:gliding motility-associated protein GldM